MTDPTQKITRNGKTLTALMWSMLEASYAAAGADPGTYLHVSQGSFRAEDPNPSSGTTHNEGGAADLRTWNLPSSVQANLCERLVVELRKRGGCAWYRDQAHGGFDPHIHVILRNDVPRPSQSGRWQVGEYDASRNGLSNAGPDYHPRPVQVPYTMPGEVPVDDGGDDDMPIILRKGNSVFRLLSGNEMANVSQASVDNLVKAGVKVVAIPNDDWPALDQAFGQTKAGA
jgi:hypothetical protein